MKRTWILCAAIALLYIADVFAMSHLYRYGVRIPGANRGLRYVAVIIALAESGVLLLLYRTMREKARVSWPAIGACAVVLAVASFLFAEPQGDAMGYIAYAKEPTLAAAYTTPRGYKPPPGFEAIRKAWPALPNAPYGPLEITLLRVTVGPAHTLAGAILVLRLIGIFSLALLFAAILRLRAGPAIAALVIANPFLYFYYVYEAHNDALPLALVMFAMVLAAPQRILSAVLAGLAALVKAPFIFIGFLAFARVRNRRAIALQIAIAVLVAVAGSAFGGAAYVRDLTSHSTGTYTAAHSSIGQFFSLIHIAVAIVALIAIAVALAIRRFNAAASFSLPSLSSFLYPWYLAWGMPYVWGTRFAAPFFVLLPALGLVVNAEAGGHVFELIVLVAVIATAKTLIPIPASTPVATTSA